MSNLTERQKQILLAVIRDFMKRANAVGSVSVVTRHNLGVSSATVRNDMVVLSEMGYLDKDHSSSGRTPTDLAFRYFIKEMLEERDLPNIEEVHARLSIFQKRFDEEEFVNEVMDFLSDNTGYAAVSQMDDDIRFTGVSKLTKYKELRKINVIEDILVMLEDKKTISKMFNKSQTADVCVLIGQECGRESMGNCSMVFSKFGYIGDKDGYIGVLGPKRMRYSSVIPTVRFVRDVMEDSVKGW